jgi:hypothetical protein
MLLLAPEGKASYDLQGFFEVSQGLSALKEDAQLVDNPPGEFGKVGKGAFLELSVFAIGFA